MVFEGLGVHGFARVTGSACQGEIFGKTGPEDVQGGGGSGVSLRDQAHLAMGSERTQLCGRPQQRWTDRGRSRHSSQSSIARSPKNSFEVVRSLSAGARPARKTLVIILLSVCALGVQSMPKQRQPLLKKGPLAWDNAKHFRPAHNNRLIIHAVDDATNLLYVKSVMSFSDGVSPASCSLRDPA